ncbi:unnamed protein product, partial [marine sediment metagenome]
MIRKKIQYSQDIRKFVKFSSFLLVISVSLAILTISNYNITPIESQNDTIQDLKSAQSWILSPFIIDDDEGGDYTWAEAVLEDWCNGSGTWGNPYIIENISINGQASTIDCCIRIKDSEVHFTIRNCNFYNSSGNGVEL